MSSGGARLDTELVRRGLARSRGHARDLVGAGSVVVGDTVAAKVSLTVEMDTAISVAASSATRWVSRAGGKLAAALDEFGAAGLDVSGRRAVDVGASTGGFTEVLLNRGATRVVAVDVGHGQLVPSLRGDPRVLDLPGTNVRDLQPAALGGPVDLLVADLSFISLQLVLPALRRLVTDTADLVLLVKPQFEVGRSRLGNSGVVRDTEAALQAVADVAGAAADCSLGVLQVMQSPVPGTTGNVEYLLWLTSRPVTEPLAVWQRWHDAQRQTDPQPPNLHPRAAAPDATSRATHGATPDPQEHR